MNGKQLSAAFVLYAPLAAFAALTGCGGGNKVTDYLTRVAALNAGGSIVGTQRSGRPSNGSAPMITASTPGGVSIPGGSTQFQITSSSTYNSAVVSIDGADGYFELTGLPGSGTMVLVVTFGQHAPQTFRVQVAAGTGTSYGPAQAIPVTLTNVGTGDVQVNVSWDVDSDVDLHVIEPSGVEIFYGNQGPTASGGQLDLDSNAACNIDSRRSENVTWPSGRAPPRGSYTVKVDLWSACQQPVTNYVVTVNVKGQQPQVFTGTFFAAEADLGSPGRTITTFTY